MDELALLDDAALIDRVRDGVDEAFEALWTRYYASAFNYARTRVGGRSFDAEEIVTDAYTKIWRSLHEGRGPSTNFRAYLYAAIRTVAWDRVVRLESPLDAVDDVAAPQLAEPTHEDDVVARCFYALNQRYRTVLWLSAVEGYKPAEVGAALGVDARHASVLIMRSKESFRKLYMGETDDLGDEVNEKDTRAKGVPGTSPTPPGQASQRKATTALGRHLLGGVAGLTAAQAMVAGANWASAATIITPPPMPTSIILAAGAAAVGGAAVASGSGGAGSASTAGSGSASASNAASGGSGGSSGGTAGASGAASGGASSAAMVAVGVVVVAAIGAAAWGISGLVRSSGPINPPPPPVVTESSSTPEPSVSVQTPFPTTTTSEPTASPTTAPPTTTVRPTTTTTTAPPAPPAPPTTQAPTQTPTKSPTPSSTPTVPWITDGSQCTDSDQWYGPWPSGPFIHCPTS